MTESINLFDGEEIFEEGIPLPPRPHKKENLEDIKYTAALDQTCFDSNSFIYKTSGHPFTMDCQ